MTEQTTITTEQRTQWRKDAETLHLGMPLRPPADRILWLLSALEAAEARASRFAQQLANIGAAQHDARLAVERVTALVKELDTPCAGACGHPACEAQADIVERLNAALAGGQ